MAQAEQQQPLDTIDAAAINMFCGKWEKDACQSEPMDDFCQLFGVPRFLQHATRLMSGLEISVVAGELQIKQVCKIRWLSTNESFPIDGTPSSPQKRRDMRSGTQTGRLQSASGQQLKLEISWGGKLEGKAHDVLTLHTAEQLVVIHQAQVTGKGSATFKEVYQKKCRP
eukprot:gene5652-5891_t